jgi:cardiolipin synthase A/B
MLDSASRPRYAAVMKRLLPVLLLLLGCDAPLTGTDDGGADSPDLAGSSAADLAPAASPDLAHPPHCAATDPRAVATTLTVQPDSGEAPFVTVLSTATQSISVMVYLMGTGGILDTLEAKAKAGVSVRVILDRSQTANQKYFDALVAAGAQVKWSSPEFTYMHAKTFIVDGREAVVSTGNYGLYNLMRERNYAAHVTDPDDIADLVTIFEADWATQPLTLGCTRLLVSPINARERLLALIGSAKKTLVIESMQFADTDVRNAVAASAAAGADVRVLLADPTWITANTDAATFLKSKGIPVRWTATPVMHVKAIAADRTTAYAGSENLSYTSLSKNREVGLILGEAPAVALIADTFDKDWAIATPF